MALMLQHEVAERVAGPAEFTLTARLS